MLIKSRVMNMILFTEHLNILLQKYEWRKLKKWIYSISNSFNAFLFRTHFEPSLIIRNGMIKETKEMEKQKKERN